MRTENNSDSFAECLRVFGETCGLMLVLVKRHEQLARSRIFANKNLVSVILVGEPEPDELVDVHCQLLRGLDRDHGRGKVGEPGEPLEAQECAKR